MFPMDIAFFMQYLYIEQLLVTDGHRVIFLLQGLTDIMVQIYLHKISLHKSYLFFLIQFFFGQLYIHFFARKEQFIEQKKKNNPSQNSQNRIEAVIDLHIGLGKKIIQKSGKSLDQFIPKIELFGYTFHIFKI